MVLRPIVLQKVLLDEGIGFSVKKNNYTAYIQRERGAAVAASTHPLLYPIL